MQTVLFRLQSEENAIELKVKDYDSGCKNLLKHFQDTNTKLFQRAGVLLLKKATATTDQLDAAFNGLQERKMTVRNADIKDHLQRAAKLRQNVLAEMIEQMLENERDGTVEDEKQT